MNYQVIARRYRPRRFEEVVGQEAVAETLRAGILHDRIAHAYLFTGPRGVGKTSMARIFAKALNCPQANDRSRPQEDWARPCDACSICETIHVGQDVDVIEMDGASHRGIEDVRSLVEGINRPATRSRYKIFIIDEVHMLTREAFNALLKTLEEPPGHVKFIFATTEAHRIPDTVVSRCQRFDFQPIREESIVRRLEQILALEGRTAEDGLLLKIARYGKGGLRDAQTLLDQALTFSDGELRADDLDRLTGRVSDETVGALASATLRGDPVAVLDRVRECFAGGADPALLLEQLIGEYRGQLHALVRREEGGAASHDAEPVFDRLLGALQILVEASGRLRSTAFAEISVELVLLKLTRLEDPASVEETIRLLRGVERRGGRETGGAVSTASESPGEAGEQSGAAGDAGGRAGPAGLGPGSISAALRASVEGRKRDGGTPRASSTASEAMSIEQRAPTATVELDPPPEAPPPVSGESALSEAPVNRSGAVCDEGAVDAPAPVDSAAESIANDAPAADVPATATAGKGAVLPPRCDFDRLVLVWEQFRIELESKHPDVAPYFKEVSPERAPDADDTILIRFSDEFFLRQMKATRRKRAFESLLQEVSGSPWKTRMEVGASRVAPAPGNGHSSASERTGRDEARPVETVSSSSAERPDGVPPGQQGISRDPLVQKCLDLFNGRLV